MLRRRRSRKDAVVETVGDARHALDDAKLRKRLDKALAHGLAARREARRGGRLRRLVGNRRLHGHVREMTKHLQWASKRATKRMERRRRLRRLVRSLAVLAPVGAFALPASRRWILARLRPPHAGWGRATIEEELEVGVPVQTAYNQWTQFEEFPLFMEGVDDVRQLDDTRLHWVASIAGNRAEWDAKIVEQVPDRTIAWESTDGRETRGTVTFEPAGAGRTRIRLRMEYAPEGVAEKLGSAAGLDSFRVRGDLERFKDLIESRGGEDGAWRGAIADGTKIEEGVETTS